MNISLTNVRVANTGRSSVTGSHALFVSLMGNLALTNLETPMSEGTSMNRLDEIEARFKTIVMGDLSTQDRHHESAKFVARDVWWLIERVRAAERVANLRSTLDSWPLREFGYADHQQVSRDYDGAHDALVALFSEPQ